MNNSKRSPEDWQALSQFWTLMFFNIAIVGMIFGLLYCVMFVTQPMVGQAKNDAFLLELLKTAVISMISIIGTLLAVNHGSQSAPPASPKPPVPQVPVKPLSANVPNNNVETP
ncbi:hypothetical protein UFOVP135_6 [uncultured Caudovirales phage]|uniref:Uncharacterized protein n=1 Tax=uncultured Caudovirales phage TaxID=2100421 RepID=A0A6J5LD25_9CAUD|nr:hypothetical protein UFOVP135_6 [uncultured Caudovirales phage]